MQRFPITLRNAALWCCVLLTAVLAGCASKPYDCASQSPTLVILAEGDDKSILGTSDVFRRLAANMEANLSGGGHRVTDSSVVLNAFPEYFDQADGRHDTREISELVRSSPGGGADVIVLLNARARTVEKDAYQRVESRLGVRIVSVKEEKTLHSFTLESDYDVAVRPNCWGSCLDDAVVDSLRPLVIEAADIVQDYVPCGRGSGGGYGGGDFVNDSGGMVTAYEIELEGFNAAEVAAIEDYIVGFSGYQSHRVTYSGATKTTYWYETRIKTAALNRNLHLAVQRTGSRAYVQFSGNTYSVRKISLRGGDTDAAQRQRELNEW